MQEDDPALAFPVGKQQPQIFRKGQTLSLRRQNASLKRANSKEKDEYGQVKLFMKILSLNREEWWIVALGVLAAIVSGAAFPLFAVLFGGVFDALSNPSNVADIFALIHPWAGGFIALGAGIGVAMFVKVSV